MNGNQSSSSALPEEHYLENRLCLGSCVLRNLSMSIEGKSRDLGSRKEVLWDMIKKPEIWIRKEEVSWNCPFAMKSLHATVNPSTPTPFYKWGNWTPGSEVVVVSVTQLDGGRIHRGQNHVPYWLTSCSINQSVSIYREMTVERTPHLLKAHQLYPSSAIHRGFILYSPGLFLCLTSAISAPACLPLCLASITRVPDTHIFFLPPVGMVCGRN